MNRPVDGIPTPTNNLDKSTFKQPERALDDLALLAAHTMDTPFVVITLHDEDGPFVKSCIGVDKKKVSEVHAFAQNQDEITIVEDARKDKHFNGLACVTKAPHFVFYAGVALKSPDGEQLGTLAVLDRTPRKLTSKQVESLHLLARQVIQLLDIKKLQNTPVQNSPAQPDAERLKHILEATRVGTWEWNVETGELRINDRWAEIIGYTKEELEPINIDLWYKVVHPNDIERTDQEFQACFNKEVVFYDAQCRMLHKNGHEVWIHDRGRVVSWTDDGKPEWMMGTHTDITEEKNTEKQLLTISDNIPGAVFRFRLSPGGKDSLEMVSKGAFELWGVSPDEAMQDNSLVWKKFDLDDLERVRESIRASARTLSHWECEWRYHHPNGNICWHRGTGNPSRTEDGSTLWDAMILDVTEQKKIEMERDSYLNALEERIKERTVLYQIAQLSNEQIPVGLMLQKAADLMPSGWQFPEITSAAISYGKSTFESGHFKKTKWSQSVERLTATGKKLEITVAYSKKMPAEDKGPFLTEEWHLLNNIADNLVLHLNHRAAIEHNELILQSTGEGIYGIDEKGGCTFINNAAAKMLGYTLEECLGQNMHELIHHHKESGDSYPESECPIYKSRTNTDGCRVNNEVFWTKENKAIPVRYSSTPIIVDGKFKGAVVVFNDISDKISAQKKLRRSEERFKSLVQEGSDLIAILDTEANYTYVSPTSTSILNISPENFVGKNAFDFIHPEDKPIVKEAFSNLEKEKRVAIDPFRFLDGNGAWIWIETAATNMIDNPAVHGIVANSRNITERLNFEQSLKDSEEKYRSLFDSSPLPMWIYDLDTGGILDVNETTTEKYGYSREEFLNLHITELRPESELPALKKVVKSVKNLTGTERFGVFTHLKKNGETMRMDVSGHRLVYDNKDSLLVVCHDVTESEAAFDALETSEARFRGFYESQTNYVIRTDMEGNYSYVNKKFEDDFGWAYPNGDIIGSNSLTSIMEYDHPKVLEVVEKCVHSPGKVHQVEIDKPSKSRGTVTTLWEFVCILNDRGEPIEIQCVGLDITDRITTEKALLQSHERFEKVTEATNDAIWDFDVANNKLFWGHGFDTMFGYNPENALPTFELLLSKIHPEDRDRVAAKVQTYMGDDSATNWHEEYRFLKADGSYAYVIDRAVFIRNHQGRVTRVVGAMTDISYRNEHERKLQNLNEQLEKHALDLERSNAELEQFAYIASHDLQEPLRMVTSFLNQLENKYNDQLDDKAQQYIYYAVDGAQRMRQIILDLLEFSRVGRLEEKKTTISLNEIMDGYCVLRKKVIEEKSAVIRYDNLPEISSYKTPVTQVFHNLVDNAIKYAKSDVTPEVLITSSDRGNYWEFEVRDNGIGIEEEYFEKIFVIFQRLHDKSEYIGTGMGLAIVRKIIDNLGGKIWLTSEPNKGSCFYFTLFKES